MDSQVLPPASANASNGNPALSPAQPGDSMPASAPPPRAPLGTRIFLGPDGLRAGWSVTLFGIFYFLILVFGAMVAFAFDRSLLNFHFTPGNALIAEAIPLFAILVAGYILSRLERRTLLDYYLRSARPVSEFFWGAATGFLALSALVGALTAGGWLRFGHTPAFSLSLARSCILWTVAFLFTALFEEGSFRCYLQFTLTRGLNFWWALAAQGLICAITLLRDNGLGGYGVYAIVALGLVPCLLLHLRRASSSSFWQAAWVTSAAFGAFHTGNAGENSIGIFAAAAIGFVFCVSIRVTGSAWWAIGCHAAWDWAETFFYGTANSGNIPQGSLFTSSPAGRVFLSGGAVGPEGSLLVIPALLLLLGLLFLLYARKQPAAVS
ncbi:MAG TPA: CPBP family intramembrane glutamic endopeptidase [Terracidiphilus sp.]|nr:CPBP family intramembrane glutamic endopeptidase [Terracidiphilus sp.]